MKIGIQTWGSDGDIRPFLALAGGLRARGHEVTLVIASVDGKDYRAFGRDMGFTVSQLDGPAYDDASALVIQNKIMKEKNALTQLEIILSYFFNPIIAPLYDAAMRLCRENDALVGHSILFPLHTAAELAGKPYATVMMNHAGVYSTYTPVFGVPDLGSWMIPYWWKLFHRMVDRSVGAEVNRLRTRVGLPPVHQVAETVWISKRLNLIAATSAISRRQPDWPDHHHVCGFFAVPAGAESWTVPNDLKQFLDAGPPPVCITLGSMFSLDCSPAIVTETLVRAALIAGCRAVVQAGWDELPGFPDHPRIYKMRRAPHRHVFPHCSAVVHHGGAGTSHSALLHGCPSVVIEHIADQPFFANQLRLLGVAPKMLHRRTLTAEKLAKAIRAVLDDPGMKRRAEELSAVMQKEQGVEKAAELIEKHLSP